MAKERLVTIGRVIKSKGVEGFLRVLPLTFDPDRFFLLKEVFLEKDTPPVLQEIEKVEVSGKYVFLKLKGVDSPEQANNLAGHEIRIPESASPALPEGTYYYYQIIGLEVYTENGKFLGKVREIIETGSNDVYSVVGGGKEILVPAIESVIREIDLDRGRITVREIEGLTGAF